MKGLLFLPRNFLLSKLPFPHLRSFLIFEVSMALLLRKSIFFFFLRIQNTRRKSQITVIITDGLNAIIHELIIIIPSITITPITLMVARSIYFVRLVCLECWKRMNESSKLNLCFRSIRANVRIGANKRRK